MSDNEDSLKDGPTRKRGSLVWQYFEKLSSVRVKCRICQHEQRYMGNTANALRHLKVKHDIDVRPIGLSDPENVKRMKELTPLGVSFEPKMSATAIKNECNFYDEEEQPNENGEKDHEDIFVKSSRNRRILNNPDNKNDIDPYSNEEPLVDFISTEHHYDEDDEDEVPNPYYNSRRNPNRKHSLEDERTKAEIEYFREKAAYFRIQKHLTALQAKKLKLELEQLYGK